MGTIYIPEGYKSPQTIRETEVAIKEVKDYFISNGTDEKTFNSYVKTYGWGYLATNLIQVRVDDYIKENIKYSDSETGSTSENAAPEATSEVTE